MVDGRGAYEAIANYTLCKNCLAVDLVGTGV
jgi:hypothetical protein